MYIYARISHSMAVGLFLVICTLHVHFGPRTLNMRLRTDQLLIFKMTSEANEAAHELKIQFRCNYEREMCSRKGNRKKKKTKTFRHSRSFTVRRQGYGENSRKTKFNIARSPNTMHLSATAASTYAFFSLTVYNEIRT